MDVFLEPITGENQEVIEIQSDRFCIGRSKDCTLTVSNPMVSRRHAELILEYDRVLLMDLGSHNGTFVNGEQVTHEYELHDGDIVTVATMLFEVHIRQTHSRTIHRMLSHRWFEESTVIGMG